MKKTLIGLGMFALVFGLFSVFASQTEAYRGDPGTKGPNCSPERHEEMLKAFENKDYSAWKNLMENRGRVSQVINESNFSKFVEAHELTLAGKTEEARKIRAELGLGLKDGSGFGKNMKRGLGR